MTEGVFAVHRGVFKHPIFANEPYTEREAWLWMLGNAVWCDERKRVNRTVFELKRGQLVGAGRYLADLWQWDESKVRRFLGKLKKDKMIDVLATREATVISVVNYDSYQFGRRTDDAPTDEPATNPRRTNDAKKKELNNLTTEERRRSVEFERFKKSYPSRGSASNPWKPAYDLFCKFVKRGIDPEWIAVSAEIYKSRCDDQKITGTEKVAQAKTWLHQERFKDYFDGVEAEATRRKALDDEMEAKGYVWKDGKWQLKTPEAA